MEAVHGNGITPDNNNNNSKADTINKGLLAL
jgi:hypothetical protein